MNYNFSLYRFTQKTVVLLLFISANAVFSQMQIPKQSDRLQQYLGFWVSSIHYKTDSVANLPLIKMNNYPKIDHSGMSVDVLQHNGTSYKHTLTELIAYDTKTDSIFALG